MRKDFLVLQEKKDRSLSRDKGTTGQVQNLATGRAGTACQNLGWDAGRDGPDFDRLSRPDPWDRRKKREKKILILKKK